MSNSLSSILYISIFSAVQAALGSEGFDPEETVFQIITQALGDEPSFDLYEQVSMALGLA
jgi:hypothetical protein